MNVAAITSALPSTNTNPNAVGGIATKALRLRIDRTSPAGSARRENSDKPRLFQVLQTSLQRGRSFTEGDEDGKPLVAIIDESTARKYWPTRDPLGRRVRFRRDPTKPWTTIVGIVKDIKSDGLDIDGVPHIYVPTYQDSNKRLSVVLRTSLSATALEPQIRHEIQSIDPGLPVFGVASMNDVLDRSLASRRFSTDLVGGFAALAVLLASIGIYGLLAYMVGERSREIGIRMALGARREDIQRMFLRKGVALAGVGVVAGLALSASSASVMASLLYGVRPHDGVVFLIVPLLLFAVAVLASYIPARHAANVDPLTAFREA